MDYKYVIYEKKEHMAYVTINRPEVMNALHHDANVELSQVFNDFKQDDESWVAIYTGAGQKAFSAGNDLKATAVAEARGEKPAFLSVPFGGITSNFECDKPIIAAVNGFALGGGFEIALACDLIIAVDHASFGQPEPRVGFIAGGGGMHRLPICTNLRKDEFIPSGDGRYYRSPKRGQQVKQRLLTAYEKPGIAPVAQLAPAAPSEPDPGLGSHAELSLTQHRDRLGTARP